MASMPSFCAPLPVYDLAMKYIIAGSHITGGESHVGDHFSIVVFQDLK